MRSHPWAQFVHMVNAVVLRITPNTLAHGHMYTHANTCAHTAPALAWQWLALLLSRQDGS